MQWRAWDVLMVNGRMLDCRTVAPTDVEKYPEKENYTQVKNTLTAIRLSFSHLPFFFFILELLAIIHPKGLFLMVTRKVSFQSDFSTVKKKV